MFRGISLKGVGGGPRPKYRFFSSGCICLANFLYFQTLFIEFKKNSPLAQKKPIRSGWQRYFLMLFSWKGHENQRNTEFQALQGTSVCLNVLQMNCKGRIHESLTFSLPNWWIRVPNPASVSCSLVSKVLETTISMVKKWDKGGNLGTFRKMSNI